MINSTTSMDCQSTSSTPASRQLASYAQKLNNSAALCIEYGQYQRAEATLTKALRLSRKYVQQQATEIESFRSYEHTLDGCIHFTEGHHRPSDHTVCSSSSMYRRPIRVPPLQTSEDCSSMGDVLSVVIVFNLGLTMHLRAIEKHGELYERENLQKSLRLYEVAYKFLHQYYSVGGKIAAIQHEGEIQFRMILCNNLYHGYQQQLSTNSSNLYGVQEDAQIRIHQERYLDELLSTLVYVAERQQCSKQERNSDNERTSTSSRFTGEYHHQMHFIDLGGFWKTVEHLVLSTNCADAAWVPWLPLLVIESCCGLSWTWKRHHQAPLPTLAAMVSSRKIAVHFGAWNSKKSGWFHKQVKHSVWAPYRSTSRFPIIRMVVDSLGTPEEARDYIKKLCTLLNSNIHNF